MPRPDTRTRRRAFTLIEVMVALTVSGIVLVGARLMVDALADATHRTLAAARDADRAANADRLLRMLAGRLEIGTVADGPFGGDQRSVRFTTWCDTPGGWLERCDASVTVAAIGDTNRLLLHLTPRQARGTVGPRTVTLATGFRSGALRYLDDPEAGGTWFIQWGDGIVAPLAIGIILDGDTSIVRIGERG
jgi:prepilin-type N-terminal cleavage/methylation domain-containing protein